MKKIIGLFFLLILGCDTKVECAIKINNWEQVILGAGSTTLGLVSAGFLCKYVKNWLDDSHRFYEVRKNLESEGVKISESSECKHDWGRDITTYHLKMIIPNDITPEKKECILKQWDELTKLYDGGFYRQVVPWLFAGSALLLIGPRVLYNQISYS